MEPSGYAPQSREPALGEWLSKDDFAQVVRLTPLVSIDLVVRSADNRVLVGRRTHEPAKGVFFVPGGRISKNETRAGAFCRISKAELGLEKELEQATFLGVYDHLYATNRLEMAGFGTHYVVLGYELRLEPEQVQPPLDQHVEFVWARPADLLASPEVHENTKVYLRLFC